MKTDMCTLLIISRSVFLRKKMFRTEIVEKIQAHFMTDIFSPENCAVFEIVWKNTVQRSRPQMTIWRMRIACWVNKATNRHSE